MAQQAEWREGARFSKLDPAVVSVELMRINERDGGIGTKVVVEEARPKDAPLHPAFEWDNRSAGEAYREIQARQLIRSVRLVGIGGASSPQFVNVRVETTAGKPQRVYRPLLEVVQDKTDLSSAVQLLAEKVASAQNALDDVKAALSASGADTEAGRIIALTEALATARILAGSLAGA